MVQFFRIAFLATGLWLAVDPGVAAANDTRASTLLPGCRGAIVPATKLPSPMEAFAEGACFGIVVGIVFSDDAVCPAKGATNEQAIKVVIQYVDKQPARRGEDLMALAQEALRAEYPCKR
jgi:hypothetical protein